MEFIARIHACYEGIIPYTVSSIADTCVFKRVSRCVQHVASFLPREAMLSAGYAVVVCLSVCVSVSLRYCIKTAKRSIMQTTLHDSPMTLVF